MKDDKTDNKLNNNSGKLLPDDQFPDWTLTPADVDIEALLEEARRGMEQSGETLEEYIERTMGIPLDALIDKTLAASDEQSRAIAQALTREMTVNETRQITAAETRQMTADEKRQITAAETRQMTADETRQITAAETRQMTADETRQIADAAEADGAADMSKTRVVTEPIDWKKAEEEESGYKGNEGRKTVTYGLTDEDVRDTISMDKPEELPQDIKDFTDRIEKRKKDNERRGVRNRLRLKIFLVALVTAIFLFVFSLSSFFTVDAIEVRGNSYFTAEEVINIAHAVPGKNLIYNTGSKDIIKYLEQNPYIKEAVVARKLPSTLVISITERKQACAFKYDDDYLIMDEEGILLNKTRTVPKITLVKGLVVSKIKLGQVIGTKDKALFEKTQDLIQSMIDADMYFVSIDMAPDEDDKNLVKAYIYETFIVKGQYDLVKANLDNGRLHKVVEELFKQKIKRGTITFTEEGTISFEPGL